MGLFQHETFIKKQQGTLLLLEMLPVCCSPRNTEKDKFQRKKSLGEGLFRPSKGCPKTGELVLEPKVVVPTPSSSAEMPTSAELARPQKSKKGLFDCDRKNNPFKHAFFSGWAVSPKHRMGCFLGQVGMSCSPGRLGLACGSCEKGGVVQLAGMPDFWSCWAGGLR